MGLFGFSQTYNPSLHATSAKAFGVSTAAPTDARSYYYDAGSFSYRPYNSTAEVLSYLNNSTKRSGKFPIYVTISGSIRIYSFLNGVTDGNLVPIDAIDKLTISDTTVFSRAGKTEILTNKTISGLSNTITDIAQSAIIGLFDSLAKKASIDTLLSVSTIRLGPGLVGATNEQNEDSILVDTADAIFDPMRATTDTANLKYRLDTLGTNKAPINNPTFTGTVGGITKTMVGLGNVDNTSDATKNSASATLTNKTLTSPIINTPRLNTTSTTGYVWKATDNLGNGNWAAESGGGGSLSSVGLTLGTSGTDAGVSGSPLTSDGSITLNLPSSSASNRGLLTSTDWSTFNNKVATSRTISTTSPLSGGGDLSANRTLTIADAAADGTTKGAATFTAADFNATSGLLSIDYTNAQAASGSLKGFLTSTDWTTFNNKIGGTTDNQLVVSSTNLNTNKALVTLSGTTPTWNLQNGFNSRIVASGNTTVTVSNPQDGDVVRLKFVQDGTGSRTLTIAGYIIPLNRSANDSTIVVGSFDNSGWTFSSNLTTWGVFSPTITTGTNVSAGILVAQREGSWTREGDLVTFTTVVNATITAANTQSSFSLSLPIPSDFTTGGAAGLFGYRCNGTVSGHKTTSATGTLSGHVTNDNSNNRVIVNFIPTETGDNYVSVTVQYRIW